MDAVRAAQISDPVRRLRYQRGRSALRSVLGIRLGINPENVTFEIAPGGKPRIAGCEFSISHSGPWLVVAISDAVVGVDIETHGRPRNVIGLAERFFSARDLASLREAPEAQRDNAFIRQWVAKEAALKCDGTGLAFHLHKAECVMDGTGILGVRWDEQRFSIHEFALRDGTPGAVAWRGGDKAHIEWRDAAEIGVS
jgi:4'-phosphopantetheinyl transferase